MIHRVLDYAREAHYAQTIPQVTETLWRWLDYKFSPMCGFKGSYVESQVDSPLCRLSLWTTTLASPCQGCYSISFLTPDTLLVLVYPAYSISPVPHRKRLSTSVTQLISYFALFKYGIHERFSNTFGIFSKNI